MDSTTTAASGAARVCAPGFVATMRWAAASHAGNLRQLNEDSWCAASPVFVVCDGMGGHATGEVASALAVGAMVALEGPQALTTQTLTAAVVEANRIILARSGGGERAMGTTLTGFAAVAHRGIAFAVVNVGDSRSYLLRGGLLRQMSVDHSQVQELIDRGIISPDQAATHPERNVVTRALGIDGDVEVDVTVHEVVPGDRWLACSDGLNGELGQTTIAELLGQGSASEAVEALVARVLAGPARDNVTAVVVDIVAMESTDDPDRTDPRRDADITRPNALIGVAEPMPTPMLIDDVPIELRVVETEAASPSQPALLIDDVPVGGESPPDLAAGTESHAP